MPFNVFVPSAEGKVLYGDRYLTRGNWITWTAHEAREEAEAEAAKIRSGAGADPVLGLLQSGPLRGMQAAVVREAGDDMPWAFTR